MNFYHILQSRSTFKSRKQLLSEDIKDDKSIIDLNPGTYQIALTSEYIPIRWGTLLIFKSLDFYGCAILISTNGEVYIRHFHIVDRSFHTDWIKLSTV